LNKKGSQIAKTLISFRVLPFGLQFGFRGSQMGCAGFGFATTRLSFGVARLFLPLFGYADAYASRGSQIAKTLTSFRVLPFGLA